MKQVDAVTHHGPTGNVTYLVGTNGSDRVSVFGLLNPDPTRAAVPILLAAPPVPIGHRVSYFENNAIFRDDKLYLTWSECGGPRSDFYAKRDEDADDDDENEAIGEGSEEDIVRVAAHDRGHSRGCAPRTLRVLRLPVGRSPQGAQLWATNDPRYGYLDSAFGVREASDAPDDVYDYQKPVLDVNAQGDVVIGYTRNGFSYRARPAYEAWYSILYHGENRPRPGVLVRRGSFADLPDADDNGKAGIDLCGAQTDPVDDHTVWVSHVYGDDAIGWFRQVTYAVSP